MQLSIRQFDTGKDGKKRMLIVITFSESKGRCSAQSRWRNTTYLDCDVSVPFLDNALQSMIFVRIKQIYIDTQFIQNKKQ